ncbi:hypothetical protein L0244_34445 [bacterium]|nr:hypothetical protein [bacterium]
MRTIWDVVTDRPTTPQTDRKKRSNEPVEMQEQFFSDEQMVYRNRLSKKIKKQLIRAKRTSEKAGGSVHVICPASATPKILNEIESTGVSFEQDKSKRTGYLVILSK